MAKTNHVICIAVPNQPAGLDKALAVIEENNISIEYMYSLITLSGNKALMVLRLKSDEMERAKIAELLSERDCDGDTERPQ